MAHSKDLSTFEILEELDKYGDNDAVGEIDIYIEPPNETGDITDCDSGDEDCNNPDRLSSRQLTSIAEIVINRGRNEVYNELEVSVSNKNKKLPLRKWTREQIHFPTKEWIHPKPRHVLSLAASSQPIEVFTIFMTDRIIQHIVDYTNKYAATNNNPTFCVSPQEIRVFLAILILSGYVPLPRRRMFWEENQDCHNILVANSMRRNRFEDIFRYLHVVDNSCLVEGDKMAKIRPFIDMLNKSFLDFAPAEREISIDESMIPYFGRHGCKQFIRGKPIRFGFKAWVASTRLGYCIYADLYQGRKEKSVQEMGLGENVVLNLVGKIQNKYPGIEYSFFTDNFFTSPRLIDKITERNCKLTGTVRDNRTEKCPLLGKNEMKKKNRGAFDSCIDQKNNICAVRWNDNSVVTLLSNEYGTEPMGTAKRYSVAAKRKIDIEQPDIVAKYNEFMGGVDQTDSNISSYRIGIRGKKWYVPIMFWGFDLIVNNAYQLARSMGSSFDKLKFRRDIATTLLLSYGQTRTKPGPSQIRNINLPISVRTHNADHVILTGQKRRRCAVCKNKTNKSCKKCEIALHDKCFESFHK